MENLWPEEGLSMIDTRHRSAKTRSRVKEKELEIRKGIHRDLRAKPEEYVEDYKVPKGGE